MGASARIVTVLLFLSAAIAVPTGDNRKYLEDEDGAHELVAESSEIVASAVAAPPRHAAASAPEHFTDHSIELEGGSQNFFPSFASLFEPRHNNYRYNFGQEGAYSQRPNSYRSLLNYPLFGNYRGEGTGGKQHAAAAAAAPLVESGAGLLGSGNFGIIRGGTFSGQNDEDDYSDDPFSSFYNNGHGRPAADLRYIANPRPNYDQDQFANFRDFADINAPANTAYSHYVVVYANNNATAAADEISQESRIRPASEPKNIIETLQMLDQTEDSPVTSPPKISKTKAKLEASRLKTLKKKSQWMNSKLNSHKQEADEPLLALS